MVKVRTQSVPCKVKFGSREVSQHRCVELCYRLVKTRYRLAVFVQVQLFNDCVSRNQASNRLDTLC